MFLETHFRFKPIFDGSCAPVIDDFLYSSFDDVLFVVDLKSSKIQLERKFSSPISCFSKKDDKFVVGLSNGNIVDLMTNKTVAGHSSSITQIIIVNELLITASSDKKVKVFRNFEVTDTIHCHDVITALTYHEGTVYAADSQGFVYTYDLSSKRALKFQLHQSTVTAIFKLPKFLVTAGVDGKLYKIHDGPFDEEKMSVPVYFNDSKRNQLFSRVNVDVVDLKFRLNSIFTVDEGFCAVGESPDVLFFDFNGEFVSKKQLKSAFQRQNQNQEKSSQNGSENVEQNNFSTKVEINEFKRGKVSKKLSKRPKIDNLADNLSKNVLVCNSYENETGVIKNYVDLEKRPLCKNIEQSTVEHQFQMLKFKYAFNLGNVSVFCTIDGEIFLCKPSDLLVLQTFFGNTEEITALEKIENHLVICSNSERLQISIDVSLLEGDFALSGICLEGHSAPIMNVVRDNNLLATCDKAGAVLIWRFHQSTQQQNDIALSVVGISLTQTIKHIPNQPTLTKPAEHLLHQHTLTKPAEHLPNNSVSNLNSTQKTEQLSNIPDSTLDSFYFTLNYRILSHEGPVNSCLLVNGLLFTVGKDGSLQIFDGSCNFTNIFSKIVHEKEINSLAHAPQQRLVFTASSDKTIKAFDYQGNLKHTLVGHKKPVWGITTTRDRLVSVSADETVRVWCLDTFTCLLTLEGHASSVVSCRTTQCGSLITAAADGCIKAWNIKKGTCLSTHKYHNAIIWGLLIHEKILSASTDGLLHCARDVTERVNEEKSKAKIAEKEARLKLEILSREKNYIQALKIAIQQKCVESAYDLSLKALKNSESHSEIIDIFLENKDAAEYVINSWLKIFKKSHATFLLCRKFFDSIAQKNKLQLLNTFKKQYSCADDLYYKIAGYELLFKSLSEKIHD